MPVNTLTKWEFRTTATAGMLNGGGFVTGASGVDYSQQDSAQYALTGVTSSGAGYVFLTATAAANMVGNIAHVISGTNFTAGWYEITSVSVGVSVTCGTNGAGTSLSTGVGSNGVINIGGALDLTGALPDSFFEQVYLGNIVYIKAGNYTLGSSISVAGTLPTIAAPAIIQGYSTVRGDNPRGATRPFIDCGANTWTLGANQYMHNVSLTGSAANVLVTGTNSNVRSVKSTNTSSTASRFAINCAAGSSIFDSEFVSQNGTAFIASVANVKLSYCYAHDSVTGFNLSGAGTSIINCIASSCSTQQITCGVSAGISPVIDGCTVYGSSAKVGSGIVLTSNATLAKLYNNIITGCATGVNVANASTSNMGAYNDFYNNTVDNTNYTKDSTDTAIDPDFANMLEITGTTATTSGSVLTQLGGDFTLVTDNVDYLRVVSGTGVTTGIYLITSHTTTTLTVNNALGTSNAGNVVFSVPVGHNFAVGDNLMGIGFPGTFTGGLTTGYETPGAAQIEAAAGSGGKGLYFMG
jgi:hypothetical protein